MSSGADARDWAWPPEDSESSARVVTSRSSAGPGPAKFHVFDYDDISISQ